MQSFSGQESYKRVSDLDCLAFGDKKLTKNFEIVS